MSKMAEARKITSAKITTFTVIIHNSHFYCFWEKAFLGVLKNVMGEIGKVTEFSFKFYKWNFVLDKNGS